MILFNEALCSTYLYTYSTLRRQRRVNKTFVHLFRFIFQVGDEVEDSVLTKTKKRTLNPKWEEEFIFRVVPEKHKLVSASNTYCYYFARNNRFKPLIVISFNPVRQAETAKLEYVYEISTCIILSIPTYDYK